MFVCCIKENTLLPLIRSRALSASVLLAKVTNPNPYMQRTKQELHALKQLSFMLNLILFNFFFLQ